MPPVTAVAAPRRRALPALVVLVLLLAGVRLVPSLAFALLVPIVAAGKASPLVALVAPGLAAVALARRPHRPGLPPTLLVYGGRDHLVEARFGRALAEQFAARVTKP